MTRPPFSITPKTLGLVADIAVAVDRLGGQGAVSPQLRRGNRIRTIQASLAIEQNTLTLEQVTAVLEGKRVLGSPSEIQEVRTAFAAYEKLQDWDPSSRQNLLEAHGLLMHGLVDKPGAFRSKGVGVVQGKAVVHMAPPAMRVPGLVQNLLDWLAQAEVHPLVASCVFHYEFEFIHPFQDGNGRMGRLWQTLILSCWNPLFAWLPIETVVRDRQADYYAVLGRCDKAGDSTEFIEFLLDAVLLALRAAPATVQVTDHVSEQVTVHVAEQVAHLLRVLGKRELAASELMNALGLSHRPTFLRNYLDPALEAQWVERTDPASPRSPRQKYRITEAGARMAKTLKKRAR